LVFALDDGETVVCEHGVDAVVADCSGGYGHCGEREACVSEDVPVADGIGSAGGG
jgi:hypothetical protein